MKRELSLRVEGLASLVHARPGHELWITTKGMRSLMDAAGVR